MVDPLDFNDPRLALGRTIDWPALGLALAVLYREQGRVVKPIRRMSGLLMLKQRYDLNNEGAVAPWRMNPYGPVFCGKRSF